MQVAHQPGRLDTVAGMTVADVGGQLQSRDRAAEGAEPAEQRRSRERPDRVAIDRQGAPMMPGTTTNTSRQGLRCIAAPSRVP